MCTGTIADGRMQPGGIPELPLLFSQRLGNQGRYRCTTFHHYISYICKLSKSLSIMESRIVELAKSILVNTNELDAYLTSNKLPQPSFSIDGPIEFGTNSPGVNRARISAIEATMELQDLLLGPTMLLRPIV